MTRALLLLDLQVDFLEPGGRLPVAPEQVGPMLALAAQALAAAKGQGDPVFAVGNEFRRGDLIANAFRGFSAIAGSPGAAWDPRAPRDGAAYFAKTESDAFSNATFGAALEAAGVERLAICGVFASACVTATARSALKRGLTVEVLREGVADGSAAKRQAALDRLAREGASLIDRY